MLSSSPSVCCPAFVALFSLEPLHLTPFFVFYDNDSFGEQDHVFFLLFQIIFGTGDQIWGLM